MFSLKLWIGPLLLLIVGGLMLTLGSSLLYELLVPPHDALIDANRTAVTGFLQTDSERSLTAASLPTANADVRAYVLAPPTEGEAPPALKEALLSVPSTRLGRPDFAVLLDKDGKVVLSAGTPSGLPEQAGGLPWARDALTGQIGDALHRGVDNVPYHLAIAPIVDKNVPTGAVALGWALDADFISRVESALTSDVVLFDGTKLVRGKSTIEDATLVDIRKAGSAGLAETEIPVPGIPFLVPQTDRYIGRSMNPYLGDKSLELLLVTDRNATFKALAFAQAGTVGITLLLFLLLVVLVMSVQKSIRRPMEVITEHLSQYAQGTLTGVIPEATLSGPFVRLAKQINMILQAPTPGSAPRPGTAPITNPSGIPAMTGPSISSSSIPAPSISSSSIPVPPPPTEGDVTFDGIPGLGASDPSPASPSVPPPTNADESGGQIAPVTQAPVSDDLASSALAGLFDDNASAADPLAAFRVDAQPTTPPVTPTPPAPAPTPPPAAASGAEGYNPEATVMFQVPEELIQESAQPGIPSQPPQAAVPPPAAPVEDRTVVAQIPQELLSKAAPKVDIAEQEQAHYREVFQDFIKTRQECGEDTSDLTFERFVAKLMKNRQAIMEKYKCKSVRFQVYVKGSKAALRALPVRD